jgi:type II secretory pathway pseudopilin PulG
VKGAAKERRPSRRRRLIAAERPILLGDGVAGVFARKECAASRDQGSAPGRTPLLGLRSRAAFTLIEVLAALLFLAIAIPAILGAISASSRSAEAAERTVIAAQLAENQLSQIIIDQSNTTGGSVSSNSSGGRGDFGQDYPGYRWEMKEEPWTAAADLTQYTVQVFFSVKGQERSVEISTLIGLPATATP